MFNPWHCAGRRDIGRYFKAAQENFIGHFRAGIFNPHRKKCEKHLDFFSTLKVCCMAGEEQNGSEIMCQECENQFMSWMLNHLSAHTFAVTAARGFCSVCRLSQPQTDFLKCRGSSTVHSPSLCSWAFWFLGSPLASWLRDLWGFPQLWVVSCCQDGILWGAPMSVMPWPGVSVCVPVFTPWGAASGESFCTWDQMWNLVPPWPWSICLRWTTVWAFHPPFSSVQSKFYYSRLLPPLIQDPIPSCSRKAVENKWARRMYQKISFSFRK